MSIQIITDCTGIKQDSIYGVFYQKFKPDPIEIIFQKGVGSKTPMDENSFSTIILDRISALGHGNKGKANFCASIQKGYYYKNTLWHFQGIVSILSNTGKLADAKTSSVPVFRKSSDKKQDNPLRNFSDIFAEDFPAWNKEKDSVFELLTREKEKDWLQQPLRYCLYQILNQ